MASASASCDPSPLDLSFMLQAANIESARELYSSLTPRQRADLALHIMDCADQSFETTVAWLARTYGGG